MVASCSFGLLTEERLLTRVQRDAHVLYSAHSLMACTSKERQKQVVISLSGSGYAHMLSMLQSLLSMPCIPGL